MIRRLPLLAAVVALVPLAACARDFPRGGCTERDQQLAFTLDRQAVLDQRPPGAAVTNSYSGCDQDDGFAYAGRYYRTSLARPEVRAFFVATALKAGYSTATSGDPCYTKTLDGLTTYLRLWFPGSTGGPATDTTAGVELTGAHDGVTGC